MQIWVRKVVPKIVKNEIAGLRQFLPRRHFLGFFLAVFCTAFWRSLGVSWAALGFLEALLGGLWTQKRVKTQCFLRFLKRLFKAHDGPLGFILVSLVNLFWILCKNPGPFWVSKLGLRFWKSGSRSTSKKTKKNNGQFLVPFLSNFGNHFGAHFGTRSAKEGARWAQESHQELQRAKKLHFQKP